MADFKYVEDPILGKGRAEFIGGGTGGESYVAGDGIEINGNTISATGGGGEGTVTGIEASVSGNTATITATGSTTSVKLVGKNGVLVQGNTNGEVELSVPALLGHAIFANSAATLAANTELVAVENCDNKKNDYIEFYCEFSEFGSVTVAHNSDGTSAYGGYIVISSTTIEIFDGTGTSKGSYSHGLTMDTFLFVRIHALNDARADITIMTKGGSYEAKKTVYHGTIGAVSCKCASALTNVQIGYVVSDANQDVWVFGDSYINLGDSTRWATQFIEAGHSDVLFCGHNGAGSMVEIASFRSLISVAKPRYVVWTLGMNNADSGAINETWKSSVDEVIATCEAAGVTPILATIPNVPAGDHTYKNAWVKASGYRYIDFATAVGAEEANSTWYTGMLAQDNLHPTALGASALMNQFILDCPESVYFEKNSNAASTSADYLILDEIVGSTVTLAPGCAYRANAVSGTTVIKTETLLSNWVGKDGFIQILLSGTGNILTYPYVTLNGELTRNAVNNCSVKFHGGIAVINVDDHYFGYLVKPNSTYTLTYGLQNFSIDYISFDYEWKGQVVPMDAQTASSKSKYVVGNGYTETIVSGGITCNGPVSFSNLGMEDVGISGGTPSLADVQIQTGATVLISNGAVDLSKVNGGTVNANGHPVYVVNGAYIDGTTICSCYNTSNGGLTLNNATLISCTITGNTCAGAAAHTLVPYNKTAFLSNCVTSGHTLNGYYRFTIQSGANLVFKDSVMNDIFTLTSGGSVTLVGSNRISGFIEAAMNNANNKGVVYISSGAIVDMTTNANSNAIYPIGGIVVDGGCTIINSAGTSSTITGGTYSKITNAGVVS